MCTITLTQTTVLSSSTGNATSIQLQGTVSSQCKNIRLTYIQGGIQHNVIVTIPPPATTPPPPMLNWTATLNGPFACGTSFIIEAVCCDAQGNPQPGCASAVLTVTPQCAPKNCCLQYTITSQAGSCDINNYRQVTFTVNYNVTDATCCPYVVQLDFGDGNFGNAHVINAPGVASFTESHSYNAASGSNYNVTLKDVTHSNCPANNLPVTIDTCTSLCCPVIGTPVVSFGDCNQNCKREVIITTPVTVGNGLSCKPVTVEWDFGGGVTSSAQTFTTSGTHSFVVSQFLDPTSSPINATLNILNPSGCTAKSLEINNIPACTMPLQCPDIIELTTSIGDCVDGKRKVTITAKLRTYGSVCSGPTELKIDFGTGDSNSQSISGSGIQVLQWTYYYPPGPYTISLTITTPQGCSNKQVSVNVPVCETPPSKPCPCCILLMILVTSYFLLWGLGYYEGDLVIAGINLGANLGYAQGIFGFLSWVIIQFCFKKVKECKKCWECRVFKCLFYALLISVIMLIVILIVDLIYGNPIWFLLAPLMVAITGLLAAWAFMNTPKCKTFFETGKCG